MSRPHHLLGLSIPQSLSLYIEGTLLDDLLDVTDSEAKIKASLATPTVGYFVGLQPPMVVVTRQGPPSPRSSIQDHVRPGGVVPQPPCSFRGPSTLIPVCRDGLPYRHHHGRSYIGPGGPPWGSLNAQGHSVFLVSQEHSKHRLSVPSCPMLWLYWIRHAYNFARAISTIYDGGSRCIPTAY